MLPVSTFGLTDFIELVNLGTAHEGDMLALALPITVEGNSIYSSLAVGRYTSKLTAKPGFGDNGIQFVPHTKASPAQPSPTSTSSIAGRLRDARERASTKGVSPLNLPRAARVGETIKVIYQETESDGLSVRSATTYLACFEADSGRPIASFEIAIEAPSAHRSKKASTQPLIVHDAVFLDDDRVLLLGDVEGTTYLTRLTHEGAPDLTFGVQGQIELPGTGYFGMAMDASLLPTARHLTSRTCKACRYAIGTLCAVNAVLD